MDGSSSTLPATAYRYLDSKWYSETKKNMTGKLSYFGFKKFDTTYQARDAFQIKYDRLDLLPNPRTDIILKEVK